MTNADQPGDQLNTALASLLFDGRHVGKPLYLDIEEDLLDAAGDLLGISGEDFARHAALAVGKILASNDHQGSLYSYARDAQRWLRNQSSEPPQFVLLLAVLSLAADQMQGDAEFSANNYYERLFALTGIVDPAAKIRARRAFSATRFLWEALNEWLRRHDGALGYPTATPVIPNWKYAGYPVSQALVRKVERQRLERMFEAFALTPGEAVQPDEMLDYLAEWIPSPESGAQFKRLWARQELRPKIAQTASLELASWEGSGRATVEGAGRQNVTAYLQFGGWLQEELHILFGIHSGSASHAEDDAKGLRFTTSPSPFEGVDFLVPHRPLHLSQVLAGGFAANTDGGQQMLRRGRPIIPFAAASTGPGFREASRISLITEHAILCHIQWAKQAETHLQNYALPGWAKQDSSALGGLPKDWIIFRNVEFLSAPEANVLNSLQCLVPLADSSLRIEKGLHLANDDWHADTGITVKGSSSGRRLAIQVVDPLSQSAHSLVSGSLSSQVAWLDAGRENGLKTGNLEARLLADGKTVRTLRFGLRSASRPRPEWSLEGIPEIYYCSTSSAPLAALGGIDKQAPGFAQGMRIAGRSAFSHLPDALESAPNLAVTGPDKAETAGLRVSLLAATGLEQTCALRGHHVWTCQPHNKGDEARDPKWQTCDGCRTTIVLKNRGQFKRAPKNKRFAKAHRATPQVKKPLPPPRPVLRLDDGRLSPNLLLDGLFYLGGGRGSRLAKIAAQAGSSAWGGLDFARNLVALGHIDVLTFGFSDQAEFWRAAPPVICDLGSGQGFLSGFRSADFVASVVKAAAEIGIEVSSTSQDLAPDAIFLSASQSSSLSELAANLAERSSLHLHFQSQAGPQLAAMFPSAKTLLEAFPETIPDTSNSLERFDPATASWVADRELLDGHAYRTTGYLRHYYYVDHSGRAVSAPYAIAKVLAAKSNGTWLHAYAAGEFSASFGCRPPALLERALISCSGLLPQRRAGRLIYTGVDDITAGLVLARLYG